MRWTAQKDDRLALLAGLPVDLLAKDLGTTGPGVKQRASILGISLVLGEGSPEGVRERWRLRLPRMKKELRDTLARLERVGA